MERHRLNGYLPRSVRHSYLVLALPISLHLDGNALAARFVQCVSQRIIAESPIATTIPTTPEAATAPQVPSFGFSQ